MLNIYKYYDDAKSLPLYYKLESALELYDNPHSWEPSSKSILEPLEHIIAKKPMLAYAYASKVIEGRWPEGEPYIMKNPYSALLYAKYVIKGRWKEAEPYIIKDVLHSLDYANEVIQGRWEDVEPDIMKVPSQALQYAKNILAKDPEWCKIPGHENGRWPEAEPYIKKSGYIWPHYKKEFGIE